MDGVKEPESKMMPIKEKVEFLTKIYDRMSSLAGNADTKAGFLLSFHGFWAISIQDGLPYNKDRISHGS